MSARIRFIMIGGFLGAGKTTTIAQLARHFQAQGKHVCIVTNDQAADLVDTELLRSYGYEVAEVAGSCFCCNFNGLTAAMDTFEQRQRPDIILAEPVGSCTDLVATVAMPMMEMLGERFEISPYAVIVKPSHGLKILAHEGQGFSPKAEYIFRKQLEEADLLLVNRVDELAPETVERIEGLLQDQFPGREILRISAKSGANIEQLAQMLQHTAQRRLQMMEVDYDVYAEGEAELGWLNASVSIESDAAFQLDKVVTEIVERLKHEFSELGAEPAHLKVIGQAEGNTAVANLISSDTRTELSLASEYSTQQAQLIVNARVAIDPEALQSSVESVVANVAQANKAKCKIESVRSFRPGRPVPTYRVTS
jgi:G3E family GTPase